jgi:hypothetical protein
MAAKGCRPLPHRQHETHLEPRLPVYEVGSLCDTKLKFSLGPVYGWVKLSGRPSPSRIERSFHSRPQSPGPPEVDQAPTRVNVTCMTPLGEGVTQTL